MACFEIVFDPVLRAPLLASLSMGVAASLMGVILFYQRHSLIGEALSHAAYPGVIVGLVLAAFLSISGDCTKTFLVFICAAFSCALGAIFIQKARFISGMKEDASLSFVISTSFALSLLALSLLQMAIPGVGKRAESFLMGQAATVSNEYAYLSAFFAFFVIVTLFFLQRSLHVSLFDREFAHLTHLSTPFIDGLFIFLLASSVMIGIKTMGVILLSSAFIFPAVSSRYLARSLRAQFVWSALLGGGISFFGVLLSDRCSRWLTDAFGSSLWLPTGPLIVLLFQLVFFLIFLFSFREGVLPKMVRKATFLFRCRCENGLKGLWSECSKYETNSIDIDRAFDYFPRSYVGRFFVLQFLYRKGFLVRCDKKLMMTTTGLLRGQKLVRLHRLWELYLVRFCGMAKERVHPHAELMEHIITPEIERELTLLLKHPVVDPHEKPIPPSFEEDFLKEKRGPR